MKLDGTDDNYDFDITPIDVRKSKYYIDNLSPVSNLGTLIISSFYDNNYKDCSLSMDGDKISGKGWKAKYLGKNEYIGYEINGEPLTFYAIQIEAVEGNYITEFFIEYSVDGK
jgi:hypothetical protein